MLYIDPNTVKLLKAKREFHIEMESFILKRVNWIKTKTTVNNELVMRLFNIHIFDHLGDILVGKPEKLMEISNYIQPFINNIPDLKTAIEYVFNYKRFTSHSKTRFDAYQLAELLDIRTCTYCNRNYTSTIIKDDGKKLTRPQFDHYFDQASHPILSLSFFNLIPSCSICNSSIKGTYKMNLDEYIHPYLDNALGDIKFTYKYSQKSKDGLRIKVDSPNLSKAKKTIEAFAIEEIYNSHTGELSDLLKTKRYFSDKYLSMIRSNLLKDVIVSKEDLYRILFGTEYNEVKFINRPFSKFKSDILKELGII